MFYDIVCPNGNEDEFVSMMDKLGYGVVYFCYDLKNYKKFDKYKSDKIKLCIKIDNIKDLTKARKVADLIVTENTERIMFEKKQADVIFNIENSELSDPLHYRESGLNQVLAKLAFNKKIKLGFSFKNILDGKDRIKKLGRIVQNVKIIRKYKNEIMIASFASCPYEMRKASDLISFYVGLGMHVSEAKKGLLFCGKK